MNIEETIFRVFSENQSEQGEEGLILKTLDIDMDGYHKILRLRGSGQKKICSAFLNKITYQCHDCSDLTCHAYCPECFIPEKHQDHVVLYYNSNGGTCDCGDIQIVKEESCCVKHQPNKHFPTIEESSLRFSTIEIKKYRHFIQVSFALLFNKIEQIIDYPPNFQKDLENAQKILQDQDLNQLIEFLKDKLLKFSEIQSQIDFLLQRITLIADKITDDNVPFSLLTSQLLYR